MHMRTASYTEDLIKFSRDSPIVAQTTCDEIFHRSQSIAKTV